MRARTNTTITAAVADLSENDRERLIIASAETEVNPRRGDVYALDIAY